MPHTVISLPSQTVRATIVLDHLKPNHSESLMRQMGRIFLANEYLYLTDQQLAVDKEQSAAKMRDALYQRISAERSLIDTGYKFTFAFFEEIESLNEERLEAILSFIKSTKQLLGAPGLEIDSFLCISKAMQDTMDALKNMDVCAERLLNDAQSDNLRIVLIDALPLKDIDLWIRAAVRGLNVLSRNNELSYRFRATYFQNTIWNWTLTEFDVDAREEDEKQLEDLKRLLYWDGIFPVSVLQQNFNSLVEIVKNRLKGAMDLPAECIPIPANVIGCCLKKRALQPNVDAFSKLLEQYYQENVTKKVVSEIVGGDVDEYCRILLGQGEREIPLNSWNQVESELKKLTDQPIGKMPESVAEYPRIAVSGLTACSNVGKMRELIQGAMDACKDSLKKFIPLYVKLVLLDNIGSFVRREEQKKRRHIENMLQKIGGTMADVQDAPDYLNRLGELIDKSMAILMLNCHSQNTFLLISDRTYADWNALYDQHLHLQNCEVFNYHSLEEFEFQSLMLTTWDREGYYKNRERFFRQYGQMM